jgi:hypothetical protein
MSRTEVKSGFAIDDIPLNGDDVPEVDELIDELIDVCD